MTHEQKEYIEKNINLIKNDDWDKFFQDAPDGTGDVLYTAGIDFMSELKTVPQGCFARSNIDSVIIPEGVTIIGSWAFQRCSSLTSITIPDSVTSIGHHTFHSCAILKSITIPNSVTYIGQGAFEYCSSLANVTIGNGVTEISEDAFRNCSSLTSINISDSVTSIDRDAFNECSSLKTVNFTGTSEQWRNITQQKTSFKNVPARKVICSDGVTLLRQ